MYNFWQTHAIVKHLLSVKFKINFSVEILINLSLYFYSFSNKIDYYEMKLLYCYKILVIMFFLLVF